MKHKHHKKEHETPGAPAAEAGGPPPAPHPPSAAEPAPVVLPAETPEEAARREDRERYLRLQADFDNFRKRTARDRAEIVLRANEDLLQDLLPVLDHLDLALEASGQHTCDAAVSDGFRMVAEQLAGVLKKTGLAPVDAAAGQAFDPRLHEAIAHVPSDAVAESLVIQQTRRGYQLGARLLRPAQVVVSSGPAGGDAAAAPGVDEAED